MITLSFFHLTIGSSSLRTYEANPDAKRLYDDLLSNYNRLIRPVINNTETLTVWLRLKLSQLIEMVNNPPINKKMQILQLYRIINFFCRI